MDYNSQRPALKLREYGRNIQYMVEHLLTIEDEERRNKAAHALIDLMGQLNPHLRIEEFRPKLWDHLFRMSGYELEVNSPYEINPPKVDNYDANPPAYPKKDTRMKQYGKNVENLIKSAVELEDEEKRRAFAKVIGNYMKMVSASSYKAHIDDESIREDLKILSDGKLIIDEDSNLDRLAQSNSHKTRRDVVGNSRKIQKSYNNNNKRRKSSSSSDRNDRNRYRKNNNKSSGGGRRK